MRKRFLIAGFLIATLSLSGCTKGKNNEVKNTKSQTQSTSQEKNEDEMALEELGIKLVKPKAWQNIEPIVEDSNKMVFNFMSTDDAKYIGEMSKKIQEKSIQNDGKTDSKEQENLIKEYAQRNKEICAIVKIEKNKAKDFLSNEECSKYKKKDKVGELNNYEYYLLYNEQGDESNLSDNGKKEMKAIYDNMNTFKESIKAFDPVKNPVEKKEEKAKEESLKGTISFKSKTLKGKDIDSSIFKENKLTMINIWGTSCMPCIDEMPELEKLSKEVKSNNVNVIGIVADATDDENKALAKEIVDKKEAKFDNITPDKNLSKWIMENVKGTPTTIFVDKDGKIVGNALVGTASKEEYKAQIEKVLGQL
ncbi:TlpA family protein disulfide reductase [Romboutsia maritimum]|uniref:TlpA family protein disulfide reductase n=1 Tax=Romboutsia maritimum TaxID=2020948 RepID=A0A371IS84_9FIRM|nr:TlpA disulfide reductase family protein [Romboutsia maritimum]RDY23348.1 TlpA family protein disulfide reductase [Romboutsia maritimum]